MRILIAICLVLTTMVPSLARADLDATDRATLNSIIEDFIRNNPEIVRDTLIALAAREEAERKQTGLAKVRDDQGCLLYTSPSPRDLSTSRMPSSA